MTITKSKQRISDFQSHVNSHAREIRDAGDQAWQKITARGEVEIVREFLAGRGRGTDYLNGNIAKLLGSAGRVVKFASIFLHQVPMVVGLKSHPSGQPAKLGKRCELGDLQTLFLYLDRDKNICQARSVIFQAKLKPHAGSHVIDHPQQRELYDECVGFEYDTVLPGYERRLPDGYGRERALQYIFVDEKPVRVRTIPSDAGQGAFESFGEHLLRFLNDSTGLDVPPAPATNDTWGRVVWDLIKHVAYEATSRGLIRNSGLKGLLDHFNHFESHEIFSIDASGGERLPEGEGGFGLQFVIVWDSELGDENTQTAEAPVVNLPEELLMMADYYLKISEPDPKKLVWIEDQAADNMAKFALNHKLSPIDLAKAARQFKHEGLIVAAAAALALMPGYDTSHLRRVASLATRNHVQLRIIKALRAAHARVRLNKSFQQSFMPVITEYLKTADESLKREIAQLRQEWMKANDEPVYLKQSS